MPHVLGVHGIAQQIRGEDLLLAEWQPALRSGLRRAGYASPETVSLACAFYGDLFRASGMRDAGLPPRTGRDVEEEWETELLMDWWREAARVEDHVLAPNAAEPTRGRLRIGIQDALNALSRSRFFAGLVHKTLFESALIAKLKQVHDYLYDPEVRIRVRQRVEEQVTHDTRVIIGHSLGSVVAYECLCAHPEWPIEAFITLGSPLGIRNLIFDRLDPAPVGGTGAWPGSVRQWTNVADDGDIIALQKDLWSLFGARVMDLRVHNGPKSHSVIAYLTTLEVGRALASAL
jgi:hypothetical protein